MVVKKEEKQNSSGQYQVESLGAYGNNLGYKQRVKIQTKEHIALGTGSLPTPPRMCHQGM